MNLCVCTCVCLSVGVATEGAEVLLSRPSLSLSLSEGESSATKSPFTIRVQHAQHLLRCRPVEHTDHRRHTHTHQTSAISLPNPLGHATDMQPKYIGSDDSHQPQRRDLRCSTFSLELSVYYYKITLAGFRNINNILFV